MMRFEGRPGGMRGAMEGFGAHLSCLEGFKDGSSRTPFPVERRIASRIPPGRVNISYADLAPTTSKISCNTSQNPLKNTPGTL